MTVDLERARRLADDAIRANLCMVLADTIRALADEVERLTAEGNGQNQALREALARLARAEDEKRRLLVAIEGDLDPLDIVTWLHAESRWWEQGAVHRASETEAKLARLREAARKVTNHLGHGEVGKWQLSPGWPDDMMNLIRLTQENPDE